MLCSCVSHEKEVVEDDGLVELPIELVQRSAPFTAGFGLISWKEHAPDSDWAKTRVDVAGIPQDWESPVVQQIWFDAHQFAYQNYKQGNINDTVFSRLKESWNIDVEREILSEVPIRCFTHIVMAKDAEGGVMYKIDTNTDEDFSDEATNQAMIIDEEKVDSLRQFAHAVSAETFINGKLKSITVPVLVLKSPRGYVLTNFPQHAQAHYKGIEIKINSGFSSPMYKESTSLYLTDTAKTKVIIGENEFIDLNGDVFENLGVNFNEQVLHLKKLPPDSIPFSTQIGFLAKPFTGSGYTTNKAISLDDYAGKYLFIEFWGTWCAPCVREIPNLKSVYAQMDKDKISFLGIVEDDPESLRSFLLKNSIPWQQILSETDNNLVDLYGVQGFPTSYLIDENGRIVAKNLRGENLMDTLNHYLH